MPLTFTYPIQAKFPGPSSVPRKQAGNNGYTTAVNGMPFKSQNMTQGGMLSSARQVYVEDAGGGPNWYSGSDVTALRRITAIGRSATKRGLPSDAKLSYRSQDNNFKNSRLQRCRSGGCVAPQEKGRYSKYL